MRTITEYAFFAIATAIALVTVDLVYELVRGVYHV